MLQASTFDTDARNRVTRCEWPSREPHRRAAAMAVAGLPSGACRTATVKKLVRAPRTTSIEGKP